MSEKITLERQFTVEMTMDNEYNAPHEPVTMQKGVAVIVLNRFTDDPGRDDGSGNSLAMGDCSETVTDIESISLFFDINGSMIKDSEMGELSKMIRQAVTVNIEDEIESGDHDD